MAGDMAPAWGPNGPPTVSIGTGGTPTDTSPIQNGTPPTTGGPVGANNFYTRYGSAPGMRYPGGSPNGPLQSTMQYAPQPYTGYGTGAPQATSFSNNPLQPNPGEIAGLGPANVQQFGGTPTVNPTYANAAMVDPNQNLAYMQQYEQLLGTSLAPQFQSQDQQMADQLAARGLTTSGAGQYLTNQLYGQQAAALATGLQPIVSQGYGYSQQDIQGNQAYQNQANFANAGASNEADVLNAQLYNQDRYANYGAYNNFENELLGLGGGQLSAQQAAYLNSFGPSTGVESAYGSALTGMQNAYGSVYGQAVNSQNQQMQQAAMFAAAGG